MAIIKPDVIQLRYYGLKNDKNTPDDSTWVGVDSKGNVSKNLLSNYGPAKKIGIQTLPGVIFYLNNLDLTNGIIVDHTGIYELDLRNTTTAITGLFFNVKSLTRIDEIDNASIIVDILY
jgi:hypothetical protein